MRVHYHIALTFVKCFFFYNIAFYFIHKIIQTKCIKIGFYVVLIKISKLQASLFDTTALNQVLLIFLFSRRFCYVALSSLSQCPV